MTKNNHVKWTLNKRLALYEGLTEKFGPYNSWENMYSPGKGLDKEFDLYRENFARTFGVNSAQAVMTQITWAIPKLKNGGLRSPGYRNKPGDRSSGLWLLQNMAAAHEAGFVNINDFADLNIAF